MSNCDLGAFALVIDDSERIAVAVLDHCKINIDRGTIKSPLPMTGADLFIAPRGLLGFYAAWEISRIAAPLPR